MEYKVEFSAPAEENLRSIFRYIQADRSVHAAQWILGLRAEARSLSTLPNRGLILRDGKDPVRRILYGNRPHIYKIGYRVIEDRRTVTILYVRHGARQSLI